MAYATLQLVPLPLRLLDVLSPARAAGLRAANYILPEPIVLAPASVAPWAGLQHLSILAGCAILILLVRSLGARFRLWTLITPILVIAVLEALYGLSQSYYLGPANVRGSWANRNHFANFEAMSLAFPAAYAMSSMEECFQAAKARAGGILSTCVRAGFSVLIMLAISRSLSRMGFAAALVGVAVTTLFATSPDAGARRITAGRVLVRIVAVAVIVIVVAIAVAPPDLIRRFGNAELADGSQREDRLLLWHESWPLVSAYPLLGTGLGGYEAAFLAVKKTSPMVRDAFAHNDYLQFLIELGGMGFSLAAVAAGAVVWRAFRLAALSRGESRAASAACCGAFAAILLHSAVDFSLYSPANALLLAWIAGIACSIDVPSRSQEVPVLVARGQGTAGEPGSPAWRW